MPEKVKFKFFEGQDVEQFTFYRIPKQLFTLDYFKGMTSDAKVLYGLMLDRVSLSLKNNWFDDDNRAYIYFSIDDVMDLLGCGRNKAIKCLKELDDETGIGLTQKRRQGFGKSNMIYVKTFMVEKTEEVKATKAADTEKQTSVHGSPAAESDEKQTSVPEPDQQISGNQTSVQSDPRAIFRDEGEKKTEYTEKISGKAEESNRIGPSEGEAAMESGVSDFRDQAFRSSQKFENQTTGSESADTEVYISNFKKKDVFLLRGNISLASSLALSHLDSGIFCRGMLNYHYAFYNDKYIEEG